MVPPVSYVKHPDGMRRSCDLFRPLNRSVCGTCHFLYAYWFWDFDSPVSFGETVGFLALGHQGLLCTCHIFVGLLVFRTVYDSLVFFGETVIFLALGRQLLSLRPLGTLMNLSSFCNPVVFFGPCPWQPCLFWWDRQLLCHGLGRFWCSFLWT